MLVLVGFVHAVVKLLHLPQHDDTLRYKQSKRESRCGQWTRWDSYTNPKCSPVVVQTIA